MYIPEIDVNADIPDSPSGALNLIAQRAPKIFTKLRTEGASEAMEKRIAHAILTKPVPSQDTVFKITRPEKRTPTEDTLYDRLMKLLDRNNSYGFPCILVVNGEYVRLKDRTKTVPASIARFLDALLSVKCHYVTEQEVINRWVVALTKLILTNDTFEEIPDITLKLPGIADKLSSNVSSAYKAVVLQ